MAAHAAAHARLQDAVAAGHPAQRRIDARAVQRMRQGRDELARRIARQPRIRVQGDHVAHLRQQRGGADQRTEIGIGRATAQQTIQRRQLAALALVADPGALAGAPQARAVQQEEAVAAFRRIALVEAHDVLRRMREQRRVAGQRRLRGVQEIGEQREMQLRIAIGQEPHFQRLGQFVDRGRVAEHARHHHQGPRAGRNALGKVHPRQRARRHQQRRRPIDQGHAQFAEHQHAQQRGRRPQPGRHRGQRMQLLKQGPGAECGDRRDRQQVRRQWQRAPRHVGPTPRARQRGDRRRQIALAVVDQVVADVTLVVQRCRLRQLQHARGHRVFAGAAAPRQQLDAVPVAVAGLEIHLRVGAMRIAAQMRLDHAQLFDEIAPVHRRQQTQAGDAVADRDLIGGLLLAFRMHHLVDALAAVGQPLLDPGHRHRQHPAAPVQRAHQFGHERAGQRRLRARHVRDHQHHALGILHGGGIEPVGPVAGQAMVDTVAHHPRRDPAQVFQQAQAQHDRNRPQLAQLQRRHRLVGGDEAAGHVGIDAAVAVCDRVHRQRIDARQPGRRALRQRRQLAAVAGRQMAPRDQDLFFDQVEVVQQPLAGGGDADVVADHRREHRQGVAQHVLVLFQPRQQHLGAAPAAHPVAARQGFAVRGHLLGAEQLCAQRLFGQRLPATMLQEQRTHAGEPAPIRKQPSTQRTPGGRHDDPEGPESPLGFMLNRRRQRQA